MGRKRSFGGKNGLHSKCTSGFSRQKVIRIVISGHVFGTRGVKYERPWERGCVHVFDDVTGNC